MKKSVLIVIFLICALFCHAAESTVVLTDTDNAEGRAAFAERERRANDLIARIDAFIEAGRTQSAAPQGGFGALTAAGNRENGYRDLLQEMQSHFESYAPFAIALNTVITAERSRIRNVGEPDDMAVMNFQLKIMPVDSAYTIMRKIYHGMNHEFDRVQIEGLNSIYELGFRAVIRNAQGMELGIIEHGGRTGSPGRRILVDPRWTDASRNFFPQNYAVRDESIRVSLRDLVEPISIQFTELSLNSQIIRAAGNPGSGWVWASGDRPNTAARGFMQVFTENFSSWNHPDFEFNVISQNTAMITGAKTVSRSINIPAQLAGRNNIVIGPRSFENRVITELTIPPSVTVIANGAFQYVPHPGNIQQCFERVNLPAGLLHLGDNAFRSRIRLRAITLPDSLQEIGAMSFFGCSSLSELIIGRGLRSISNSAFAGTALRNLVIPDNIEIIGNSSFQHGTDVNAREPGTLQSLSLGRGIRQIGNNAFRNQRLNSIEIPDNVRLGSDAFSGDIYIGANVFNRIVLGRNVIIQPRDRFDFNIANGGRITLPAGLERYPSLIVPGGDDSGGVLRNLYEQNGRQAGTYEVNVSARTWTRLAGQ